MTLRTPLYDSHISLGAKMVDFAGWDMPVTYGSQVEEHHSVRHNAGVFDVSHMGVVDLEGAQVQAFLCFLLANDVRKLDKPGKALYSCLLNEQGGILDDLIVYFRDFNRYRVVVNAATREKDLAWMARYASRFGVTVSPRKDLAMLAVQGPLAIEKVQRVLEPSYAETVSKLSRFYSAARAEWFIARTGYTGEDGLEIILPSHEVVDLWDQILAQGVPPVGLGARDTLRLEAGMSLYGADMDETITPFESGLGWTVVLDSSRDFLGKNALVDQRKQGVTQKMVGLLLEGRGVLRHNQRVLTSNGETLGCVTSGSFSPTLQRSIALARIDKSLEGGGCKVEIRGKQIPAKIVKYPFIKGGTANI
ncbi:MAG: glycine cleavage system aminomethyltransferase GcvT [Gammaproteobacteria bacterium]|nr:glycine cleavage system aminomethyltransferase GcvT [Gammaproteobacteria bacterium]